VQKKEEKEKRKGKQKKRTEDAFCDMDLQKEKGQPKKKGIPAFNSTGSSEGEKEKKGGKRSASLVLPHSCRKNGEKSSEDKETEQVGPREKTREEKKKKKRRRRGRTCKKKKDQVSLLDSPKRIAQFAAKKGEKKSPFSTASGASEKGRGEKKRLMSLFRWPSFVGQRNGEGKRVPLTEEAKRRGGTRDCYLFSTSWKSGTRPYADGGPATGPCHNRKNLASIIAKKGPNSLAKRGGRGEEESCDADRIRITIKRPPQG